MPTGAGRIQLLLTALSGGKRQDSSRRFRARILQISECLRFNKSNIRRDLLVISVWGGREGGCGVVPSREARWKHEPTYRHLAEERRSVESYPSFRCRGGRSVGSHRRRRRAVGTRAPIGLEAAGRRTGDDRLATGWEWPCGLGWCNRGARPSASIRPRSRPWCRWGRLAPSWGPNPNPSMILSPSAWRCSPCDHVTRACLGFPAICKWIVYHFIVNCCGVVRLADKWIHFNVGLRLLFF